MTQTEFAELAGFASIRHVGLLEEGKRPNMTSQTATRICGLLGCSLDWLLLGKDPPPTIEGMRAAIANARAVRAEKEPAA